VFLQEERVVEGDLARLHGEIIPLRLKLEVVDPFVAVADFLEKTEG